MSGARKCKVCGGTVRSLAHYASYIADVAERAQNAQGSEVYAVLGGASYWLDEMVANACGLCHRDCLRAFIGQLAGLMLWRRA